MLQWLPVQCETEQNMDALQPALGVQFVYPLDDDRCRLIAESDGPGQGEVILGSDP